VITRPLNCGVRRRMGANRDLLVGRRVLVGLTYLDGNGALLESKEVYGTIVAVGDHTVKFEQSNGKPFSIPFDGELEAADPEAVYTLKGTGESISAVDFVATYTIRAAKGKRTT
jgi:hypothetical protein